MMKNRVLYLLLAAVALTACTGIWLKSHDSPDRPIRPDPW